MDNLVTEPELCKVKKRFCFDKRWLQWKDIDRVVEGAWNQEQKGSLMYKVCARIRICRVEILKWSKRLPRNSKKQIQALKQDMDELCSKGDRDWK